MAIYNTSSKSSYSKNPDYIPVLNKATGSPRKKTKISVFWPFHTSLSQIPE